MKEKKKKNPGGLLPNVNDGSCGVVRLISPLWVLIVKEQFVRTEQEILLAPSLPYPTRLRHLQNQRNVMDEPALGQSYRFVLRYHEEGNLTYPSASP